ncbi:MAG: hypothetical protein NTX24_00670 [Candidatus Pacearchaeota archaeon]|nr:hypothetical protein [Candidatus Pacearchaeota archaeon]
MRIKLKEGFQRSLILDSKNKNNLTWKDLSKILKINENYLRSELFNEKRLISEEIFNNLCKISEKDYHLFILEKLSDDWGRSKGGKNSVKKEKLLIKEKSKELAELIGIILGDGNIWEKKGYYYLTICGNSEKDSDYLLNYVQTLFKKLFSKNLHVRKHNRIKELFLYIGDKNLIHTLKHFGLFSGDKKRNNVKIPAWIFESDDYLRACIRGLIDTDGCVCPITGRNYSYIWFSSDIKGIQETFSLAMSSLGIKTSKWNIKKNGTPDIYIGGKKEIKKYLETISFKNKRNLDKLMLR